MAGSVDRRTALGLLLVSIAISPVAAASSRWRFLDPVRISAEDIAWFRQCRIVWLDGEAGAPGLVPAEMSLDELEDALESGGSPILARLERVMNAFFLHASFLPGNVSLTPKIDGVGEFQVTPDHLKLLRVTSWRECLIDNKRPYGDFTHYQIDMAAALGLPISKDAAGYAQVEPAWEKRLTEMHRSMQYVLAAYVQHARLEPGDWFVQYDYNAGWGPRCTPVGPEAVADYKAVMAAAGVRPGMAIPDKVDIPGLGRAVEALYRSP